MFTETETLVASPGLKQTHGIPQMPGEAFMSVAKAFKIILAADGTIAPAEHDAYVDTCKTYGATESMLAELESFDPYSTTLESALSGIDKSKVPVRGLLYDAVKVACADGRLADAEDAAVQKAARLLGIDRSVVDAIVAIVRMEEGVRTARIGLLSNADFG